MTFCTARSRTGTGKRERIRAAHRRNRWTTTHQLPCTSQNFQLLFSRRTTDDVQLERVVQNRVRSGAAEKARNILSSAEQYNNIKNAILRISNNQSIGKESKTAMGKSFDGRFRRFLCWLRNGTNNASKLCVRASSRYSQNKNGTKSINKSESEWQTEEWWWFPLLVRLNWTSRMHVWCVSWRFVYVANELKSPIKREEIELFMLAPGSIGKSRNFLVRKERRVGL